jgi:hypothetical protein
MTGFHLFAFAMLLDRVDNRLGHAQPLVDGQMIEPRP